LQKTELENLIKTIVSGGFCYEYNHNIPGGKKKKLKYNPESNIAYCDEHNLAFILRNTDKIDEKDLIGIKYIDPPEWLNILNVVPGDRITEKIQKGLCPKCDKLLFFGFKYLRNIQPFCFSCNQTYYYIHLTNSFSDDSRNFDKTGYIIVDIKNPNKTPFVFNSCSSSDINIPNNIELILQCLKNNLYSDAQTIAGFCNNCNTFGIEVDFNINLQKCNACKTELKTPSIIMSKKTGGLKNSHFLNINRKMNFFY
jgi:phage FluMu protein Com